MLHNDRSLFEQVILRVSEETGIEGSIIEKDYYVTRFLQRISEQLPNIIFKGGTSLSKCYKLIHRFSEDID
ncbi:MAG: nucleotidyl transferase AbiEii/AbiGii toxin family protein, partial [Clostridia bacterium]|nr:nucleotidyl transferase AbiEii/AbiGii toxin family protein [Clostridia bacterium]